MIDVSRIRYDLVVVTPQGERLHVNEFKQGLSWEEPRDEISVRLQARFHNQKVGDRWLHQLFPMGGRLFLYSDWGAGWQEVWRGTVFRRNNAANPLGNFQVTAYDMLIYLMKSKDNRYYPHGTTARTILTDICNAWGVPLGTVEGPDVAVAKKVMRSQRIGETIIEVLQEAKRKGGGKFILRAREDRAEIIRQGGNSPVFHFGHDDSVSQVEDQEDIEDLVTRVMIIGSQEEDEGRAPVVAVIDGRTEFGVLQEIIAEEKEDSPVTAQEVANDILADRGKPRESKKVSAPDLPFLRRGDKVHITADTLDGYYLVAAVQHNADERRMLMEVERIDY